MRWNKRKKVDRCEQDGFHNDSNQPPETTKSGGSFSARRRSVAGRRSSLASWRRLFRPRGPPFLFQKPQPLHRDPHFVSSDPQNRELTSPYLVSSGCSRASPDHPPRLLFPQAPRRWLSLFPSSAGAFFGPSDGSPGRRRQQMRPLAQPTACIPPDSPLTRVRRLACGVPAALPLSARPPCSTPLRAASPL